MIKGKEKCYIFNFIDGDRGDDSEAFIKAALDYEPIHSWAYVLHDKEYYNQHDMAVRKGGCQRCWADGFLGMEKYANIREYIEDEMSKPPFIGDKKESRWYIFLITDINAVDEEISDRFGMPNKHYMRCLTDKPAIKDAIQMLVNKDRIGVGMGEHHYPDEDVRSNFNFRELMESIHVDPRNPARLDPRYYLPRKTWFSRLFSRGKD